MKTIGALLLLGLGGLGVHHAVTTPATVEAASNAISRTETDLKDAATMTRAQANQLSAGLTKPDRQAALPKELQDFNRSTEHLVTLRDHLRQDIKDYETAYNNKLAAFDQERAGITDAATQRSMTNLRRHTEEDITDRLNNARTTLDHLDTVLSQGTSLQHAAKCVLIADELHTHGTDLDSQLQAAQQAANTYASTTTNLLERINQALAE